jgi:hypothetical protein
MKLSIKSFLSIALLASSAGIYADSCESSCNTSCESECTPSTTATSCDFSNCSADQNNCCEDNIYFGKTHYSYRPQGTNAFRRLIGLQDKTHVFGREEFYGVVSLALSFQQTFNRDSNCKRSFGTWFSPICSNKFIFGPDQNAPTEELNPRLPAATGVTNELKEGVHVSSLDFGLSSTHKSTLAIHPKIKNVIADLDFWFGLDEFICGLWARVNVPLVWTKWEMCSTETTANEGGNHYGTGVAACSANVPGVPAPNNPVVYTSQRDAWCATKGGFGDVPALENGKLCSCKEDDFSVSGVRFDLGYDFWRSECGYLGLALTAVAGVGTQPKAESIFAPVVGAQHSWQFGGNLVGAYELWNEEDSSVSLLTDITATHIFKHKQRRLFGLKNHGTWSHQLLLKKLKKDTNGDFSHIGFERAANILAGEVKIKCDVMVDAACAIAYRNCNFTGTLGVDVWYRSQEKIVDNCGFSIQENTYGIMGTTGSCSVQTASLSTINTSKGTGLNNTQNSVGNGVPLDVNDGYINPNLLPPLFNTITLDATQIDPYPGLHPDALSGKIFGALEYAWDDCEWQPFVVAAGAVEIGRGNTAADQWEIIFKSGISF